MKKLYCKACIHVFCGAAEGPFAQDILFLFRAARLTAGSPKRKGMEVMKKLCFFSVGCLI